VLEPPLPAQAERLLLGHRLGRPDPGSLATALTSTVGVGNITR
jgi:hypothetical protein